MNEIRKNINTEEIILKAKFKIPKIVALIYICAIILFAFFLAIGFLTLLDEYWTDPTLFIISLILFIVAITLFALQSKAIKSSTVIVTNKQIKGVVCVALIKKKFCYRLDEIDNVELRSILGIHELRLHFSQGYGDSSPITYRKGGKLASGKNLFSVLYISNHQEVYEKLSDLLCSIKNDRDLRADIEMSRIDVENRKATAFEHIANKLDSTAEKTVNEDYISQLKRLKELLDCGIISKEEFEIKKKELLK